MRQLEILATPSQASTTDKARAVVEEIALRNHLICFSRSYPFKPQEARYQLQIAAQLPGYFHFWEAQEIIQATDAWRWGEPQALGRLGVLIESALARTALGGAK